jgi:hypothetical protein
MNDAILFDKRSTAAKLGISVRSLEHLVTLREIMPRRIGKRVLFEAREISRFSRCDHRTKPHDDARN